MILIKIKNRKIFKILKKLKKFKNLKKVKDLEAFGFSCLTILVGLVSVIILFGCIGVENKSPNLNPNQSILNSGSSNKESPYDIGKVEPPVVYDVNLVKPILPDTVTSLILSYTAAAKHQITACSVSNLKNIKLVGAESCSCKNGLCSLKVISNLHYHGPASFNYAVSTSKGIISNTATYAFTISEVPSAPVVYDIFPPGIVHDVPSNITLRYTADNDAKASSCMLTNFSHILSNGCNCLAGNCNALVTSDHNYTGPASFSYSVIVEGRSSNNAMAYFSVIPRPTSSGVDRPPEAYNIIPPSFGEHTVSTVYLNYTDGRGYQGNFCEVTPPANLAISTPCACNSSGVCSVGVRGTPDHFYGTPISFTYNVTSTSGLRSNNANAAISIYPLYDPPVTTPIVWNTLLTLNVPALITLKNPLTGTPSFIDYYQRPITGCMISDLSQVVQTTPCTCTTGSGGSSDCYVGIMSISSRPTPAGFNYQVVSGGVLSSKNWVFVGVNGVDVYPQANDMSVSISENTPSIVTLSYRDPVAVATACAVTPSDTLEITSACECTPSTTIGVQNCQVGILNSTPYHNSNFYPVPSFNMGFKVFTSGLTPVATLASNLANVSVKVDPVYYPPIVSGEVTPIPPLVEDTPTYIVYLNYKVLDPERPSANSCMVTPDNNLSIVNPCRCAGGSGATPNSCWVGLMNSTPHASGTGTFSYLVSANGLISMPTGAVSVDIAEVNYPPNPISFVGSPINENDFSSPIVIATGVAFTDVEGDSPDSCYVTPVISTAASGTPILTIATPCSCGDASYGGAGFCGFSVKAVNYRNSVTDGGLAKINYFLKENSSSISVPAVISLPVTPVSYPPVITATISPASLVEDTATNFTLGYQHLDPEVLASSCMVTPVSNLIFNGGANCSCSSGVCKVSLINSSHSHLASGTFNYQIVAGGIYATPTGDVTVSFTPHYYDPVGLGYITPAVISAVSASPTPLTLIYTYDGSPAVSCTAVPLQGLITPATSNCSCNGSGVCQASFLNAPGYAGLASFKYSVAVPNRNGGSDNISSNWSTVDLSIYWPHSNWVWMDGQKTSSNPPNYGNPPARSDANLMCSRNSSDPAYGQDTYSLWLFGGLASDNGSGTPQAYLNDLRKYDTASNTWSVIKGNATPGVYSASYGNLGTPASANIPGSRFGASGYIIGDYPISPNIYIFGGIGKNSTSNTTLLNDLWNYSSTNGNWTWISGDSTPSSGTYPANAGIFGYSASYKPSARAYAGNWSYLTGDNFLWCFGGVGIDSTGASGYLNDLWVFDVASGAWSWVSGNKTANASGAINTAMGVPDVTNWPGARMQMATLPDATPGNLWLFGGYGIDTSGAVTEGYLGDLWKFIPGNPSDPGAILGGGTWALMSGTPDTKDYAGVYGTMGTEAATNFPGARKGSKMWSAIDPTSNVYYIYLFGGYGMSATPTPGNLNDLWRFNTSNNKWTWMGVDSSMSADAGGGVYGSMRTPSPEGTNFPGARNGAAACTTNNSLTVFSSGSGVGSGEGADTKMWLFGGYGMSATPTPGYLNDLWQLQ